MEKFPATYFSEGLEMDATCSFLFSYVNMCKKYDEYDVG